MWSENNLGVFGAGEPIWLVPKPWMVNFLVVVVQELIFAFVVLLCLLVLAFAASEPLVLLGGQRSQLVEESDFFSACFQTCMSLVDRHRLVSDTFDGRCTLHAHGSTNSCGVWAC